eukprot:15433412-Alexandrium_andersonii.AAC.1
MVHAVHFRAIRRGSAANRQGQVRGRDSRPGNRLEGVRVFDVRLCARRPVLTVKQNDRLGNRGGRA